MKLTIIGSGTILPDPARGPCALLLEAAGRRILVDGGSGTLRTLARLGADPRHLDAGVYSHRHLDHIGELPSLFFLFRVTGRVRAYPLFGGGGLGAFGERLEALHGRLTTDFEAPVHELSLSSADSVQIAPGLVLRTRPANHTHGALHLRFEADHASVVFSGDTGPSPALADLASGADLLVTECAFPAPNPDHLCPDDVAAIAAAARPGRIALTHFYPEVDEGQALTRIASSGVPVERAWDGWTWESRGPTPG